MSVYRMKVLKYLPHLYFGFAVDKCGTQVFFHLNDFQGEGLSPIVGEDVDVDVDLQSKSLGAKAPKANRVIRVEEPKHLYGVIEIYHHDKDYGFIKGDDNVNYHLHRSEVIENKIPIEGKRVSFYAGTRKDRPRACYVNVDLKKEVEK